MKAEPEVRDPSHCPLRSANEVELFLSVPPTRYTARLTGMGSAQPHTHNFLLLLRQER